MKKTTIILGFLIAGAALTVGLAEGQAGTVRTKDPQGKCGGYQDGKYTLKGCDKAYNFEKKQGWRNPFKGFTKGVEGPKKRKGTPPNYDN